MRSFERVSEIPRESWISATGDTTFWGSLEWLSAMEHIFSPTWRYHLAERGAAAFYQVGAGTYPFYDPYQILREEDCVPMSVRPRVLELADRIPREALQPAAIASSPGGFSSGLWTTDAVALDALVDELERAAEGWGSATTGVLFVQDGQTGHDQVLTARGYQRMALGADSVMRCGFADFDGYLAERGARRKHIRNEVSAFRRSGIEIKTGTVADQVERVSALAAALEAKYGRDLTPEEFGFVLLNIEQKTEPYVSLIYGERPDGTMAGFVLYCIRDGVLHPMITGFDRQSDRREFAYFNMVYYELIRRAPQLGVHTIEYGIGTYQAKAARGCELRPVWAYLRVPEAHRAVFGEIAALVTAGWAEELGRYGG